MINRIIKALRSLFVISQVYVIEDAQFDNIQEETKDDRETPMLDSSALQDKVFVYPTELSEIVKDIYGYNKRGKRINCSFVCDHSISSNISGGLNCIRLLCIPENFSQYKSTEFDIYVTIQKGMIKIGYICFAD